MDRRERCVLLVASLGHALCHVSTLVLQQVVPEASRDLRMAGIGWLVALAPFLMGCFALPAGALGDRFGLRRVYALYLALLVVATAAAALAPAAWLFVPAVALVGIAAAFHHPVGLAWLGEALPQRRAQALGIHGFVGHFGSTLAPLLVLLLAQQLGWRHAYSGIAVVAALLLALLAATPRTAGEREARSEAAPPGRVPWRLLATPALLFLCVAMIPNGLVHQGFWSSWTSFVRAEAGALEPAPPGTGLSLAPLAHRIAAVLPAALLGEGGRAAPSLTAIAGLIATFVCAFGSFGELFGARCARRRGGLRLYAAMNAISAVGLAGVAWLEGPALLAAGALFTFFHFGTQPVENELLAARSDLRVRGLAYGGKFVVSFGLGALAADPAIAGWRAHGFAPVFLALAGLALGGVGVALWARHRSAPAAGVGVTAERARSGPRAP